MNKNIKYNPAKQFNNTSPVECLKSKNGIIIERFKSKNGIIICAIFFYINLFISWNESLRNYTHTWS